MEYQAQLLTPFQRKLLLKSMETDLRPEYRRRIQIMLMADEGQSQTQICAALECSQETARYWIAMARAGKAHHWQDHPTGRPKTVNTHYLNRLKELVSHSPQDYGYSFKRWTANWLGKHLAKELGIQLSERYISILLKEMGLSTRARREKAATDLPKTKDSMIAIRDLSSSVEPSSVDFFLAVQSRQNESVMPL
ncbi:helix-turn-helix domain-containing protein [Mastigocladopsis repens]|uniref:helix-turn-helix domain-containing protein n=1 Tax=Mastigocladopsis repens TaxID=221287 RepID=UPI00037E279B|nr:helix-turn-helix domain-containing protein [Mastigocladopsis repens]